MPAKYDIFVRFILKNFFFLPETKTEKLKMYALNG